jgi:phosphatidylserine/phosphatidylglycerophosphate/cardiolipin synthase-like enzyme
MNFSYEKAGTALARQMSTMRLNRYVLLGLLFAALYPSTARAQVPFDQFCDTAYENCRLPLLQLINNEQVAIDVGMWFIEDSGFASALVARKQAGVQIRILMDPRSNVQHPAQPPRLTQLANAGIPMRKRIAAGIEHWKIMVFHGQGKLYFGSANFSADGFKYYEDAQGNPQYYVNYVDETIYFTNNQSLVQSFMTRFDDAWTNTTAYAWYANATPTLERRQQPFPVNPELNLPPGEDFINRTVARLNAENNRIDVMMYRIDDNRATNAMINALNRGVPIRLIVDQHMYRDASRYPIAFHFDRLFAAGVPMKFTVHQGINHGKLAMLHGQGMTIFGSSNWTTPSANLQHENNWFTTQDNVFDYFQEYFLRRWNNTAPNGAVETGPFVPQPPDRPVHVAPADVTVGASPTGVQLEWSGGYWGQYYDIYFGTTPDPPLFAENRFLGPNPASNPTHTFPLPPLTPGTTYYWKVRGKTAADVSRTSAVWSFTTAGAPPPPPEGAETVVLWMANLPPANIQGDWAIGNDASAAGGKSIWNPNRGRAKIAPALANPTNYFETTFQAVAGARYHLWIRMRAQSNSTSNDSVHVQFSDSVDSLGNPIARINTAASLEPVLQNGPSGGPPSGWGWTDNGWGGMGPDIYFATSGEHTIRVQQREDGPTIDQIVLSPDPDTYLLQAPGSRTNDATPPLPENDGGSPPPPPPPPPVDDTIVLWTSDLTSGQLHGNWQRTVDGTAAGNFAVWNGDQGSTKIAPALSSPPNYFEASFTADANRAYRIWIRARADADLLDNDSVHMQFSDSVTSTGAQTARIGSSSSLELLLQAGSGGSAPRSWGWTDTGWGSPGAPIYFANSGVHTLRIQQREDGITIDQIVISPDTYLTTPPGPRRDDFTILPRKGGAAPPPPPPPPSSEQTIVLWPGASTGTVIAGSWQKIQDATAAGGWAVRNPNAGAAKIAPARQTPTNYFEMTFEAPADTAYHVWIRMRADSNSTSNDSVHLQFNDSVDASGTPFAQIGTTSSAELVLQDGPSGAAPRSWGWTDNGWETNGPPIFFATGQTHTLRIQQREDGAIIDQIVLSPSTDAYFDSPPGQSRDDVVILAEQQP